MLPLHCSCRESKSKEEYDGIDTDNLITLERLKQNQRQDYLKVCTSPNIRTVKTEPAARLSQSMYLP